MTNIASLDSIRQAAEARYGSFTVTLDDDSALILRNPLKLSKEEREKLQCLQDRLSEDGEDQGELLSELLKLVATSTAMANKLLKAVGGDLTVLVEIFSQYSEATQAGEA